MFHNSANDQKMHQWLGRAIALLALAQIPLGLTLYGSPKVLFILYAVWMAILVFAYFIFSHRFQSGGGDDYSSYYGGRTDITGDSRPPPRKGHGLLGALAAGGLAATALGALSRRRRSEDKTHTEVTSHHSGSYVDDKYSDEGRKDHTWRNRLLTVGAGLGALGLARKFLGRKDDVSEVSYSQATESDRRTSYTDVSRVEEGHGHSHGHSTPDRHHGLGTAAAVGAAAVGAAALAGHHSGSPGRPPRRGHRSGQSVGSFDESESFYSPGKEKRKTHTVRDGLATLGVAGYLKHKFNQSRQKREDNRVESVLEEERQDERRAKRTGRGGRRYTGDGRLRKQRPASYTESDMTPLEGSTPGLSRHNLGRTAAAGAAGVAAGAALAHAHSHAHSDAQSSISNLPPPPPRIVDHSSGSEAYISNGGTRHHRHHSGAMGDAAAAGLGAAAGAGLAGRRRSSVNSPPLSIKMRMRNEGGRQQVTLRRLNAEEAAAERARRARNGSVSSVGGAPGASGDEHWRRVEARERAEAAEISRHSLAYGEDQHNVPPVPLGGPSGSGLPPPPPLGRPQHMGSSSPLSDLPPPPPIPGASYSALDSPGYNTGDSLAGSRADSNRRRRRAERARAEQAARERRGTKVEFE
jgi:hypothetical protein